MIETAEEDSEEDEVVAYDNPWKPEIEEVEFPWWKYFYKGWEN